MNNYYDLAYFIPVDVFEEIMEVLRHGEEKHGEEWKTKPARHHFKHAREHMNAWLDGQNIEAESGKAHLAHAIVRLMFALAIEKGVK